MSTSEKLPDSTTEASVPKQGGRRAARAAAAAAAAAARAEAAPAQATPAQATPAGANPAGANPAGANPAGATSVDITPPVVTTTPAQAGPGSPGPARRPSRRLLLGVGAGVLVVAGAGAWAVVGPGFGGSSFGPPGSRTAEIELPATIDGLAAAPEQSDFGSQPIWQDKAKSAVAGATVIGRAYGSAKQRHTVRVVAARADLTNKLELAWAADSGHAVGDGRCTQNVKLSPTSPAAVRPTMMLCWRTSATFSAYSITIRFDQDPTDKEGMLAVDAAINQPA